MPACFSRAPVTSPANPPPMNATVTSSVNGSRGVGATYGIVEEVREPAGRLEVLVVAVVAQPLVALGPVARCAGRRGRWSSRRSKPW